ncbi:hypothetical protein [Kitasatospora sp. NBC_00315]|uniref:hypothetical protein n=1 Tax=Kitasatospora sp. NBC_00315 TaxID=2975963 RepID=UPI00324A0942
MNELQHVVRRSALLSRLLTALVALAFLLLLHGLVRDNLSAASAAHWPWRPRLLDTQSATAALLATGGAALARAQYARTVRPALGGQGRVMAGLAPDGRLVWAAALLNAAQDVAVITEVSYLVTRSAATEDGPPEPVTGWVDSLTARAAVRELGPVHHRDFLLTVLARGYPLAPQSTVVLSWFTEQAMSQVAEVYVRVRVEDRVGDVHERIVRCLKDAERAPSHPSPDPL